MVDATLLARATPCETRYCAAALQSACDDGCARPRSGHELPTGAISYGPATSGGGDGEADGGGKSGGGAGGGLGGAEGSHGGSVGEFLHWLAFGLAMHGRKPPVAGSKK